MSHMRTAIVCGNLCTAPEGDYFVTCSFDPNHVLLRSRMPYHIVKCVKQHKGHNKIQCPYDATEYIDKDLLASHLLECESKKSICSEKYELADLKARGCTGRIQRTPFFHACAPVQDEEWSGPIDNEEGSSKDFIHKKTYYDDDDDDVYLGPIKGVGRGMMLNKPTPEKGRGRAALLKRIYQEYQEKQSLGTSRLQSTSEKDKALKENIVQDQFDDS